MRRSRAASTIRRILLGYKASYNINAGSNTQIQGRFILPLPLRRVPRNRRTFQKGPIRTNTAASVFRTVFGRLQSRPLDPPGPPLGRPWAPLGPPRPPLRSLWALLGLPSDPLNPPYCKNTIKHNGFSIIFLRPHSPQGASLGDPSAPKGPLEPPRGPPGRPKDPPWAPLVYFRLILGPKRVPTNGTKSPFCPPGGPQDPPGGLQESFWALSAPFWTLFVPF